MKKYTKKDGINPQPPFKENDVLVYESHHGEMPDQYLILDHIEKTTLKLGDIYYKAHAYRQGKEIKLTLYKDGEKRDNHRSWFNHDSLRRATAEECRDLIFALYKLCDNPDNLGIIFGYPATVSI